jgi:hypothetical protein
MNISAKFDEVALHETRIQKCCSHIPHKLLMSENVIIMPTMGHKKAREGLLYSFITK